MIKKKEIFIIIIIVLLTLIIAFYPKLFDNDDSNATINPDETRYIKITISGEIKVDSQTYEVPYGSTLGNLMYQINLIKNDYTIMPTDYKTRLYKDTQIILDTIDIGNKYSDDEKIEGASALININTAPKELLVTIYGIGEKRADKIIEARKTNKITSFIELKSLLGVSDEIIEKIKKQAVCQ